MRNVDEIGGASFENGLLKHWASIATQSNLIASMSALVLFWLPTLLRKPQTMTPVSKWILLHHGPRQVHAECGAKWWSHLWKQSVENIGLELQPNPTLLQASVHLCPFWLPTLLRKTPHMTPVSKWTLLHHGPRQVHAACGPNWWSQFSKQTVEKLGLNFGPMQDSCKHQCIRAHFRVPRLLRKPPHMTPLSKWILLHHGPRQVHVERSKLVEPVVKTEC